MNLLKTIVSGMDENYSDRGIPEYLKLEKRNSDIFMQLMKNQQIKELICEIDSNDGLIQGILKEYYYKKGIGDGIELILSLRKDNEESINKFSTIEKLQHENEQLKSILSNILDECSKLTKLIKNNGENE